MNVPPLYRGFGGYIFIDWSLLEELRLSTAEDRMLTNFFYVLDTLDLMCDIPPR
jgi:hypothetical protein